MQPQRIGKYEVIREIARSNDIVFEAWDPLMQRRVAVKLLELSQYLSPEARAERIARFRREARAAGTLSHPNIVTIFEVGEDNGRHFIAMEFLEGQTLRELINTVGPMSPERALEIVSSLLNALRVAHGKGVVHRDIKPENIQVTPDGRPILTDFGIARVVFESQITIAGQVFGTPAYMAPEQLRGFDPAPESDLYSVGVLYYELLTGRKPFDAREIAVLTTMILTDLPDLTPIPSELRPLLGRLLAKSPSDRPRSADEVLRTVSIPQGGSIVPPVHLSVGVPATGPRKYAGWIVSACTVLVVFAIGVASTKNSATPASSPPPVNQSPEIASSSGSDEARIDTSSYSTPPSDTNEAYSSSANLADQTVDDEVIEELPDHFTDPSLTPVSGGTLFTVHVPKTWLTLDLTDPNYEEVIDDRAKVMPEVVGIKNLVRGYAQGGQFRIIAFDVENTRDGFTDNMNMIAAPVPVGTTLQQVVEANSVDLEGLLAPGTDVDVNYFEAAGHEVAHFVWYQASGDKRLSMDTFFFIDGEEYFTFTFTSSQRNSNRFRRQALEIIKTLCFECC